ncbi:MAG: ComEC/Rec2 family competence protein [Acidobacteria bacterium]|nr:ComEC/Rec2 family competence protein [Acidobacteriota bacterium]
MRKPLAGPALIFAGGIVLSRLAPFQAWEPLVCALALASLATLSFQRQSPRLGRVCAWLTFAALGVWAAVLHPNPVPPATQLGARHLEGCVVESSTVRGERTLFTLEIANLGRARVSLPAAGGTPPESLLYGERVALDARLRRIRGFHNEGAFDVELYQARRGVFWNATAARGQGVQRIEGACGEPWRRTLEGWRGAALARIGRLYGEDSYHAAMMRGLLLGDKSGIRRAWVEDFRRTGTYHALVISGSHITLVCGIILLWLRCSGFGERTLLVLAGVLAWLYALLAGGDAPVVRAAAGFSLFVAAALLYRRSSVLNVLAAVALAYLVLDPGQLFEASFQLSFLAVAVMGLFGEGKEDPEAPRAMARRLELRLAAETLHHVTRLPLAAAQRMFQWLEAGALALWGLLRISALVQAGLALPMVLLFHRVSLTGLSANLAVIPLISLAVPAGFLGAFTGWRWAAGLAAWFLDLARSAAAWHMRFEPDYRVADPPLWLALAIPLVMLAWAAASRPRARWGLAAAYAALLALLTWQPWERGGPAADRLELTALDVGQGESLVAALPDGELAIIDGGGLPQSGRRQGDYYDVGEEVVSPYLWRRGVARVAVVAVTHLHDDHAGGIAALLRNFRPRELWTGFAPDHPAWNRLSSLARELRIAVRVLKQGDRLTLGGVEWQVLAPAREQPWSGKPRNNDSLVLRARHGRTAFLLTGDAERGVEARLMEEGLAAETQVLKVAHHGSRLSSMSAFLDLLHPAVAVISAGEGNAYHLPNVQVVEELRRRGITILRTDEAGQVSVSSDGRTITVDRWRRGRESGWSWDAF